MRWKDTMMRLATLGLLLMAAPAYARVIEQYTYAPDKVYPVRTGLGITTQIELSPHEEILDFSTGFSGGWDISRRGNVFYLKPKNVDVDTNLLVRKPDWDIKVSKTGYINEAGECLVMMTRINGRDIAIVLLDSQGKYSRIGDAVRMRRILQSDVASLAPATGSKVMSMR